MFGLLLLLYNLHAPRQDVAPSVYSTEEVLAALYAIDRETDVGRALYLV